jgi:hypothetical protein
MPGVATVLVLYPAESLAVVVLANKSAVPTGRIAAAMTAAVVPSYAAVRRMAADAARQARAEREAAGPSGPTADDGAAETATRAQLVGKWSGVVLVRGDSLPLTLDIPVEGSARVRAGNQSESEMSVRIQDVRAGWLTGRFEGEILGADAAGAGAQGRHTVHLTLERRGERLTGWASVITTGSLSYGAVSYRVELDR